MSFELTECEDGRVFVQVRSTRGAGTDDRDHVTVSAIYEDIEEAENESHRLNRIAKDRLTDAREVGVDGEVRSPPSPESGIDDPSGTEPEGEPNAASPVPSRDVSNPGAVSKVYLGEGADTSGWVPVPTEIVLEEIVPLVQRFETDEEHVETIFVNFSKDIPTSGWTNVDAGVVTNRIEPIIDAYRADPAPHD